MSSPFFPPPPPLFLLASWWRFVFLESSSQNVVQVHIDYTLLIAFASNIQLRLLLLCVFPLSYFFLKIFLLRSYFVCVHFTSGVGDGGADNLSQFVSPPTHIQGVGDKVGNKWDEHKNDTILLLFIGCQRKKMGCVKLKLIKPRKS